MMISIHPKAKMKEKVKSQPPLSITFKEMQEYVENLINTNKHRLVLLSNLRNCKIDTFLITLYRDEENKEEKNSKEHSLQKNKQEQEWSCSLCKKKFRTFQAKGGHMSKVHQGESKSYNKKMTTYKSRMYERELLKRAQKQLEKGTA